VDRLQVVAAIAGDREDREVTEQPGDVVNQDIAFAKEQRWPDDGIREAG